MGLIRQDECEPLGYCRVYSHEQMGLIRQDGCESLILKAIFIRTNEPHQTGWMWITLIMDIERKAVIRNRYNYQTPSVQETKGKEKATVPQSNQNTTSRKPKGQFLSEIIGQTAIQNKNFTRTYMQRHTATEKVNHSRSTASERSVKTLLGGVVGGWMRGGGGGGGGVA